MGRGLFVVLYCWYELLLREWVYVGNKKKFKCLPSVLYCFR